MRKWEKKKIQKIARERMERLFQLAEENAMEHPERARRYVELARKIGQRYNVPTPAEWKYRFCKRCNSFWIPGETVIVRVKPEPQPHVEYICLVCGARRRKPYLREKKNQTTTQ